MKQTTSSRLHFGFRFCVPSWHLSSSILQSPRQQNDSQYFSLQQDRQTGRRFNWLNDNCHGIKCYISERKTTIKNKEELPDVRGIQQLQFSDLITHAYAAYVRSSSHQLQVLFLFCSDMSQICANRLTKTIFDIELKLRQPQSSLFTDKGTV